MRLFHIVIALLALLILPFSQASARTHDSAKNTNEGRPLSVLMHDQVPVIAANYAEIILRGEALLGNEALSTKDRAALTDFLGYSQEMHWRSLGGWVPGTTGYDWNPFHVTYHASLRSAFDALTIIKANEALMPAGGQLYDRMNNTMFGRLVVCANTYDDITTASIIGPNWQSYRNFNMASMSENARLLVQLSLLLAVLIVAVVAAHLRATRRPTPKPVF